MSVSLEEALSQVELEAGKTYQCRVNGKTIMVRVVKSLPLPPIEIDENEIMLDPWVELPLPKTSGVLIQSKPGKLPPPDFPEIPQDEEAA